MLFVENVKLALSSIRINKMRSFLTMLGIIIGISSVIAITSIGESAKRTINAEFEGITSFMYVYMDYSIGNDGAIDFYPYWLSEDDMASLKERFSEDIRYICPSESAGSEVKIGNNKANTQFIGIAANFFKLHNSYNLIHGRQFEEKDEKAGKDIVYISKQMAQYLFKVDNAVGKTITATLKGETVDLTVVGIYEERVSIFTKLAKGNTYFAFTPYKILMDSDGTTDTIEVLGTESKNQDAQGKAFSKYLQTIKKAPEGMYTYETLQSQLGIANKILTVLSVAIGAIAGIALIVGGIGIMNIMLVSVTERTREIGIRKSLGAKTGDILTQFIMEAMILSVIGGIIGTTLGISIAALGMIAVKAKVAINPVIVVIAVLFSAMVGMFFGIFPARKAAKLDPIEALRYE